MKLPLLLLFVRGVLSINHNSTPSKYLQQLLTSDDCIAEKGFMELLVVDLTSDSTFGDFYGDVFRSGNIVVQLVHGQKLEKLKAWPDVVIIAVETATKAFHETIDKMDISKKFVVIAKFSSSDDEMSEVAKLARMSRDAGIYKLIIIVESSGGFRVYRPSGESEMRIEEATDFAWPFKNDTKTIAMIQYDSPPFSYVRNSRVFGIDGRILDEFCKATGYDYKLINHNHSAIDVVGVLLTLHFLKSDLSMNDEFIAIGSKRITWIDAHEIDGTCLLVPRNIPTSWTQTLLEIAEFWTIILILVTMAAFILALKFVSMMSDSKWTFGFIIFETFKLSMQQFHFHGQQLNYKHYLMLVPFMYASIFLVNFYQSMLIAFMLSDSNYKSFETFAELNQSGTKINEYVLEMPVKFGNHQVVSMKTIHEGLGMAVPRNFDPDMAYFVKCFYASAFVESRRNFKDNRRIFDVLPQRITSYMKTYPISKAVPYKEKLQWFVDGFWESGIKDYWIKKLLETVEVNSFGSKAKDEKMFVDLQGMLMPMTVLCVGLTFALLVFVAEMMCFHCCK